MLKIGFTAEIFCKISHTTNLLLNISHHTNKQSDILIGERRYKMTVEQVTQAMKNVTGKDGTLSIYDAAKEATKLFNVSFEIAKQAVTDLVFGTVDGKL
jgi:hypothetical protein